ncbi:MAG: acyltransferase family protein [Promethearchaeota archaeon]
MEYRENFVLVKDQEKLDHFESLSISINSLKTIAILQMIIWHCYYFVRFLPLRTHSNVIIHSLIEIGDFSGDMYALLSGFLLTYILTRTNYDNHSWKEWYKKRLIRIFPIFLIATIAYVSYHIFIVGGSYTINTILVHMSGLQSIPTQPLSVFLRIESSQWFITFILICYSIFPLFYYFLRKRFKLTAILTLSLYIIYLIFSRTIFGLLKGGISIIFQESLYWWQFGLTTLRYFDFFFGMIIGYWIGKEPEKNISFLKNRKIGISVLIFFLILVITYVIFTLWRYTFLDLPIILYNPLLAILLFILVVSTLNKKRKINRILTFPGERLYEIFLFHPLIIYIMADIVFDLIGLEKTILLLILLIPLIIIISIIIAIPYYNLGKIIKRKKNYHIIIIIFTISLIIYGFINIIYDFSKGILFNFGQEIYNLNALFLYFVILLFISSIYCINLLVKRYKEGKVSISELSKEI